MCLCFLNIYTFSKILGQLWIKDLKQKNFSNQCFNNCLLKLIKTNIYKQNFSLTDCENNFII